MTVWEVIIKYLQYSLGACLGARGEPVFVGEILLGNTDRDVL